MNKKFRHTKIVFTIGPATSKEEVLERLIETGVDICRINMAHADHAWTRDTVNTVRSVCTRVGRQIAFMMDVKGPEIRTGAVDETHELQAGQLIDLTVGEPTKEDGVFAVDVNYPGILNDVNEGDTVLVDSGLIRMAIIEKRANRLRCQVKVPGPLGSRRHINLPGVKINLPSLTEKDKSDIKLAIELGIEFFALSFVRKADDLDLMRRFIVSRGSEARIVAKIEDQSAITNLEEIIQASDGLMVARGDLGIEIPFEELPLVQRRAVEFCKTVGKPVIIATHMLESMIEKPMPTRAEITDVANAVFEEADCVMLSGETTTGLYPTECVDVLNRIIWSIEAGQTTGHNQTLRLKSGKAKMLRSAVILAESLGHSGIVVFTRSGHLARVLAALRPRGCPIYAFTDVPMVFKQSLILWGVEPFLIDFRENEQTIQTAFDFLKRRGWVQSGDQLVIVTNALAGDRIVDTLQLRSVE